MGEVFRAQDTKLKRDVALKALPSDLAGDDERLQRFQREAEALVLRASEMRPDHLPIKFGQFNLAILQENWQVAQDLADAFAEFPMPFAQSASRFMSAVVDTYRGTRPDLVGMARETMESRAAAGPNRAGFARAWAGILFSHGHLEEALELARQARAEGPGFEDDYQCHGFEVLTQQQPGQERRADLSLQELENRVAEIPGPRWQSYAATIRGTLHHLRGEEDAAIAILSEVEEAMPPALDQAIPLYFYLGSAFLEAGRAEEQLGNREAAIAAYQRFLDYWGEGDFDPERVAHASRFESSS